MALQYSERGLEICKSYFGQEDELTLQFLENIGVYYRNMKNFKNALNCFNENL